MNDDQIKAWAEKTAETAMRLDALLVALSADPGTRIDYVKNDARLTKKGTPDDH